MKRFLILAALAVGGCFPTPPAGATTFIQDGMLCWEEGDPSSNIGTALTCEVLP